MSNGKKIPHAESVREGNKPQITNASRTETTYEKQQTPLFCINGGRLPKGVFSPFEIAAEASKIFTKKK